MTEVQTLLPLCDVSGPPLVGCCYDSRVNAVMCASPQSQAPTDVPVLDRFGLICFAALILLVGMRHVRKAL